MRQLRGFLYKWRFYIITVFVVYGLFLYIPMAQHEQRQTHNREKIQQSGPKMSPIEKEEKPEEGIDVKEVEKAVFPEIEEELQKEPEKTEEAKEEPKSENNGYVLFSPEGTEPFYVESIMTNYGLSLKEKFDCKADKNAPPKVILSLNAGHSSANLGGCPDWNCQFTHDRSKADTADAVLIMYDDSSYTHANKNQYAIYFSQESPKNSGTRPPSADFFNMSLGFRHDSPAASPYGYTVKLAPASYRKGQLIDGRLVEGKSKGAAWFVSHCNTNSQREQIVSILKEAFPVDIYGACGDKKCPRGGDCERALDTDYHFYVAFENSICKDYITEKLWNQGYKRDVVPLVLKRSLVEPFVPPNSFIAVDDFETTQQMAEHLHYLMKNKTAYMQYFEWRRAYRVIFLDGNRHDVHERPWGFCQICRLIWEQPRKKYTIDNFDAYWSATCEKDGDLAQPILRKSGNGKIASDDSAGIQNPVNNGNVRRIPKKNGV